MMHNKQGQQDKESVALSTIIERSVAFLALITLGGASFFITQYGNNDAFAITAIILTLVGFGIFYLIATVFGICRLTLHANHNKTLIAMFNHIPEALVITDSQGYIRYMNQRYRQLTGDKKRHPERLFCTEEQATHAIWRLKKLAQEQKNGYEELYFPHGLGGSDRLHITKQETEQAIFSVNVSTAEVAGEAIHIWSIADITKRRHTQERQFDLLAQAIEHLDEAPAGFIAWNKTGVITYCNTRLASWIGFDLADPTSKRLTLSGLVGAQCAMELQQYLTKNHRSSPSPMFEIDLFCLDGRRLPIQFYCGNVRNDENLSGRALLIRRQAKPIRSHHAETAIDEYFNSCPIALATIDAQGMVHAFNPRFEKLFGHFPDKEQTIPRLLEQKIISSDRKRLTQAIEQTLLEGEAPPLNTRLNNNLVDEESTIYIKLFLHRLEHSSPRPELVMVGAIETSEQRALEQQMEQGQKMQAVGQLAGGIAHDFNNVLTAIIMSCDLLLSNHRSSDPSHPDLMNIKNNANRAASLVRQLLAFSRRQTLRPKKIDLSDMLADIRLLLTRLVGIAITLKIEHGRDLWPVMADISELERAIINLATNARDAMPSGGILTIRTANVTEQEWEEKGTPQLTKGDYVLIEVRDNGIGMPDKVREKIFEPFFTTKEVGRGTGLGLSMVYGIIIQTGGHIQCESMPNQGTCFYIYLPRHVDETAQELDENLSGTQIKASPSPAALPLLRDLSGSSTVLVVEDEDGVRAGSVKALQSRGYKVFEAASGIQALETIKNLQGQVDIVVSDVVMPEMDGPTLLKSLREHYPPIKFVFVSGYAEDAFAKNLPKDAHFAFLSKPFSLKQLATIVKETLEKQ